MGESGLDRLFDVDRDDPERSENRHGTTLGVSEQAEEYVLDAQ